MPEIRLAEMLKKRRMSKYRFAKLLALSTKNVHRYFRPEYDPKLSTLARWSQVLGCRIRDLFRE